MTRALKKPEQPPGANGSGQQPHKGQQTDLSDQEQTDKKPRAILCAHCSHPITHSRELCTIQGDSEHRYINPAGIYFHIQCFFTAPGCMLLGPSTSEHSWFKGYYWQMAYCAQCQCHLGWHYEGHSPNFFGLIKNRLHPQA